MKPMEKMKNMKKSRRGAALIMALVVVLVGGLFITVIFDFVSQHGVFSQAERRMYVDHTTLVSHLQSMKGRIVANNLASGDHGATRHTEALNTKHAVQEPTLGDLELADLRFGGPGDPDDWYIEEEPVSSGLGVQYVDVEVYDMFFKLEWIDEDALNDKDFPPTFRMMGEQGAGGGGENEGEANAHNTATGISSPGQNITPANYGAYLVRARLYDHRGKTEGRLLRTMEEAFVQIIPPEE